VRHIKCTSDYQAIAVAAQSDTCSRYSLAVVLLDRRFTGHVANAT
jgi:hypothetical protein